MLNLNPAISWAKNELSEISKDLPSIKKESYLVFSSPFGQCKLTSELSEIVKDFPKFFVADDNFSQVKSNIKEIKNLEQNGESPEKIKKLKDQTEELLKTLIPEKNVLIEFRFNDLDYDLIEKLKNHPKIQQPTEMMRPAYIRVILCSLDHALNVSQK